MRSFQGDASHRYFRVAVMVRQTAEPSCTSILYPDSGRQSGTTQTSRGAFPDTASLCGVCYYRLRVCQREERPR